MYAGHFDFSVPLLGTIEEVWPRAACARIIEAASPGEWLTAKVNAASGRVVDERLRNNDTAIVRDAALADDLFSRIRDHVPSPMSADWDEGRRTSVSARGLFLPLRIYRYLPGQRFGLHQDQSYRRDDGARSLLTLLVYLDDECEGGETDFPEQRRRISPRAGAALWFQHMLLHAGLPVTRGVKHVLRTDVLYAP